MGLPFKPESYEELNARLPQCLARVWGLVEMASGNDRPGLHRENVFDTIEGFRLIMSHTNGHGVDVLHLSVSLENDPKYVTKLKQQGVSTAAQLSKLAIEEFKKISGLDKTGIAETVTTDGGVMHFIFPLDEQMLNNPFGRS